MRRLFLNWNATHAFQVEDAGVELLCDGWTGAVVQRVTKPADSKPVQLGERSLYVRMPRSYDRAQLRDHLLVLLDAAQHQLNVSRTVFCLERDLPDLATLLHGLCYVGGQVTSRGGQMDTWSRTVPMPSLVLVTVSL